MTSNQGAADNAQAKRRPKPVRLGERRTLRFDEECERAIDAVWTALARSRGYDPRALRAKQAAGRARVNADGKPSPRRPESGEPTFTEALRILVVSQFKAAQLLAGQPEAWPTADTIDMAPAYWEVLTACRNDISATRASMYVVLRDVNFKNAADPAVVAAGFTAVAALEARVKELESVLDYLVAGSGSGGHEPDDDADEAA